MVYAVGVPSVISDPLGGRFASLSQVFGVLINVVLGVGVALTVVYLILGGIKYMMSQGDQKATQTAREWLTNAIIGFIVVIGAFVIKTVVSNVLGGATVVISEVTP